VIGGVGFYQRREIKDVLSYLRVFDNPYDEAAFARALKAPPKGVGDALIEKVHDCAAENNMDMLSAAEMLIPVLPKRQAAGLSIFRNIMYNIVSCAKISEMISIVIDESGYKDYLTETEDVEEAKARTENIYELFNAAVLFEEQTTGGTLADFLATTTLVTSSDEESKDSVRLMSIHGAKGLEFEAVFVTGLEEGVFPSTMREEDDNIEEERRLCYVAATRAKRWLTFSYTNSRVRHGKRDLMRPSRFVHELGVTAAKVELATNPHFAPAADGSLRKGQSVKHEIFGDGIVMQVEGSGDSAKVDVFFKKGGMKKLVARFLQA
jgi:DNA helicase-2/ATP-dependent DNA helicase PcrA